jgi:septation ring formation regulator EzrA
MERMVWTADRLQERFDSIDRRFDEIDRRFAEVDRRFDEVDRKFEAMDRRFDRVEAEIAALRTTLNRVGGGTLVGLVAVIATVFLHGGA